MRHHVDFLVIGSGIAGLSFALKVAEFGKVIILTKNRAEEGSTKYAQGGIATVMQAVDSYEKHIQDTLVCGDGLCDEEIVSLTINQSTERITELINWGIQFDKKATGEFDLAREGGHSEFRVLHHKDNTGFEIEQRLLNQVRIHPNIELLEHFFAIDLITQHHLGIEVNRRTPDIKCFGVYALNPNTKKIDTILSKITMLATGGNGNIYSTTTNPITATGDGVAMVHRARGIIENIEFVQFHPTSLYNPKENPSFLITEAMRGSGGILKTLDGKEFMDKYDSRKSLAPRDIVARAIDNEMKISGNDYVYLDCLHISKEEIMNHFPNIYAKCLEIGINITRDMIPVVPAAHYNCGGIKVDSSARSSILNLYASGECSSTGLHGANRLASNSLLEAIVFSHNAAMDAIDKYKTIEFYNEIPDWNDEGMILNEEMVLITQTLKELQAIMSNYVGIVRSNLRLQRAFDRLEIIHRETEALYNKSVLTPRICELRNMIANAYLVIKKAQERKESRGLHYSLDYPKM